MDRTPRRHARLESTPVLLDVTAACLSTMDVSSLVEGVLEKLTEWVAQPEAERTDTRLTLSACPRLHDALDLTEVVQIVPRIHPAHVIDRFFPALLVQAELLALRSA